MFSKKVFILASLLSMSASAEELIISGINYGDVNATLTGASDDKFRGISQTDRLPAAFASIEYSLNGFKVNFTDNNVKFNGLGGEQYTSLASYTYKLNDNLSAETGATYKAFVNAPSYTDNYGEVFEAVTYSTDVAKITTSFNYSPNFFADSGNAYYPKLAVSIPLKYDFVLDGSVGHQWVENNASFGLPDYSDYELGLAYNYRGFTLKGAYIDTSLNKNNCVNYTVCSGEGVFSVSKSF